MEIKEMKKIVLAMSVLVLSAFAIELGQVPKAVTLSGKAGGKVGGGAWHSSMLKGKVYTLFYVDPDKKDLNDPLAKALIAQKYDRKKLDSVAIINLAATWMPNALIEQKLKGKQKQYPHTTYVKDKEKVLVKKWGLGDDNSDILIFDKKGKLIYKKFGKVSPSEIKKVIALINKHL